MYLNGPVTPPFNVKNSMGLTQEIFDALHWQRSSIILARIFTALQAHSIDPSVFGPMNLRAGGADNETQLQFRLKGAREKFAGTIKIGIRQSASGVVRNIIFYVQGSTRSLKEPLFNPVKLLDNKVRAFLMDMNKLYKAH